MDVLIFFQNWREATGGAFNDFFLAASYAGKDVLCIYLVAFVYWCIDKRMGQEMMVTFSFSGVANQWLQRIIKLPRPWVRDSRIHPISEAIDSSTGYSFPDSVMQEQTTTFGYFLVKGKVLHTRIICFIVMFLTVLSGLYLGTHTLRDYIAGLVLAIVILKIVKKVLVWVDKSLRNEIIFIVVSLIIITIPMVYYSRFNVAGAAYGFIIGWALEKHRVGFENATNIKTRLLRFLPGLIGIYLINMRSEEYLQLILSLDYEYFMMDFLVAFFVAYIYPAIFNAIETHKVKSLLVRCLAVVAAFAVIIGGSQLYQYVSFIYTPCKIIAEGGYSAIDPINTLDSIGDAIDIGTNMVELDVQQTKDHQIVVCSNEFVKCNGVQRKVSKCSLDALVNGDVAYSEGALSSVSSTDAKKIYGKMGLISLEQALEYIGDTNNVDVYIRILDYDHEDTVDTEYIKAIADTVKASGFCKDISQGVIYESTNADTLHEIATYDDDAELSLSVERITSRLLTRNNDLDYFSVDIDMLNTTMVDLVHDASVGVIANNVDAPLEISDAIEFGCDGLITGYVGMARVLTKENYVYMSYNYQDSITVPALYDDLIYDDYSSYVMQGLTKVRDFTLVSAYDSNHEKNSIIYVMNGSNKLTRIIDVGFKAHLGGMAYDEEHDILWFTGSKGKVCGAVWSDVAKTGEIDVKYKFDPGLYSNTGEHVASYLSLSDGNLYVGSYCVAQSGLLKQYKVADLLEDTDSEPEVTYTIPEKVQGVTVYYDDYVGQDVMILTQCNGYKKSNLLIQYLTPGETYYDYIKTSIDIPGMVEQPLMTDDGLYLLFESSAREYRASFRVPNDQIWLLSY